MKTNLKKALISILDKTPDYLNRLTEFKIFLRSRLNWNPQESTVNDYVRRYKMNKL